MKYIYSREYKCICKQINIQEYIQKQVKKYSTETMAGKQFLGGGGG